MRKTLFMLFFVGFIYAANCDCDGGECSTKASVDKLTSNSTHNINVAENKMATQIVALLEHYKQTDPLGIPGAKIPDPFPVEPIKKSVGVGTLSLKNSQAYGLSKFRIKNIQFDVNELMVKCEIQLDVFLIKGDYTLSTFFSSANGPFTVTLKNVVAKGNASVGVERDGVIRTQDISMDMTFDDLAMDFQNLGFMGSIFQSVINGAPNLVFDSMKPSMLKEAYTKMRVEVDTKIKETMKGYTLPNSISPLDMAIGEARRKVREMGYDPYIVRNYNHTVGLFAVQLTNTWISGISSFYRVGDLVLGLDNNTITIELHVGTQEILGSTQWEVSAGKGMITRVGHVDFTVQYAQVVVVLSQSLDTRNQPQINDLQLELGNIQVRSDGAGTFDYVVEFLVNVLPNLLRYQIMDALENPVKVKIQEEMNKINVEKLIKDNIPTFEKMQQDQAFDISDFKY